jgi:lia operon protein LiaG
MRSPARSAALVLSLFVLALPIAGQQVERHTLAGPEVAIYNLAGSVRVESGTGSDVVVEVTRGGANAGSLRVEAGPFQGRQALRVIYPDDRVVYRALGRYSSSTLTVQEDGTFGGSGRGGRRVKVSGRGDGLEAHADLRVMVPAGKRVRVALGVGRATVRDVTGDLAIDAASADIDASQTKGPLSLDTGSGNVTVTGVEGEVHIDTGSGNVAVSTAQGGDLQIDTGSGDITVSGARAGRLVLETGSGGIRASGLEAEEAMLESGSGSIQLELVTRPREVAIETGSGDVTVRVPDGFGASVDIDTGSGGIDLGGLTITATRLDRDHVSGTIGDGRGRVRIETGSGSVRLTPR